MKIKVEIGNLDISVVVKVRPDVGSTDALALSNVVVYSNASVVETKRELIRFLSVVQGELEKLELEDKDYLDRQMSLSLGQKV